ncbi:hypothetical protein A7U60_g4361 [Sanghuangporus baumii]|uniref:Uncharacterized protein n=1 Tax=Sanghuangporus baumii TaxID=108892 RepID=A0A9Q5N9B5_SANBA|nr:hypothetical protein A7U60_g4361 [Sanghuangporus baumii]
MPSVTRLSSSDIRIKVNLRPMLLNLGQTALLVAPGRKFLPNSGAKTDPNSSHVVQVTVEPYECVEGKRLRRADTIAAFFLVQHEVSELITAVLRAHLTNSLRTPVKFVQQDGPTPYCLIADSQPWPFGKTLGLSWGGERLIPGELKWTFKFSTIGLNEPS